MKLLLHIEGMHCMHCAGKVEKALTEMGLEARVDLEKKTCLVSGQADQEAIRQAIAQRGFQVTAIDTL